MRKSLSILLALNLAATQAVAIPPTPPPPPPQPPQVLCLNRSVGAENGSIVTTGTRIAHPQLRAPSPLAPSYAPPPPPPPAPPPPPTVSVGQSMSASPAIAGVPAYARAEDRERYAGKKVAAVQRAADTPVSTFSIDVDTGSYSNSRRFLLGGGTPPAAAVRTEEFLNYFRYDYPRPTDRTRPFSVTTDVAATPWNADTRLIRVGLRGYDVAREHRPSANLVFLVDVSGSMQSEDKLPLVKAALSGLADRLNPGDRVSIVVYAGAAGLVLRPTHNKQAVKAALGCLDAGGSTAGGDGIRLAYAVAREAFIENGINRVILATDGDFNVGTTSDEALKELVKQQRESGITLTTLGFGTGNYNETMMEAIADVGNGNYGYVDSAMEAQKLLEAELSSTLFTIARDVKVQVEFNPAAIAEYRLIGYENRALRDEDFANDRVDAGDIGAGHQVTALYEVVPVGARGWLGERRYAPAAAGAGRGEEAAWVKLRYKLPGEEASRLIEQPIALAALRGPGPPRGDFAFAAAVAAFGQRLRGDAQLRGYDFGDIRRLAGDGGNYWRQEFVKLVGLAQRSAPSSGGSE
ncbi:MAG: VWA domain-containing protein [Pseudomonadota bacterium]|nr:VWA domain-containing protein [Pseudomonadota bacterium]